MNSLRRRYRCTLLLILAAIALPHALHAQSQALLPDPLWQRMNGPSAGTIHSLARAPNGTLIAGSWTGGIYRSTDDGLTWSEPDTSLHHIKSQSVAAAPNGHFFAACTATNSDYTQNGFYRSTDNGTSWQRTTDDGPNPFPTAAAATPNGDIYQGSFEGAFRSTDEGATWKPIGSVGSSGFVNAMAAGADGTVYFCTAELAAPARFVRYDPAGGGRSLSLPVQTQNIYSLLAARNGDVYAGAYEGLYRSTDRGATWTAIKPGGSTLGSVNALGTDSSGRIYAAAGTYGAYRSDDHGATWMAVMKGVLNVGIRAFVLDTADNLFACTWGDGVYYSADHGDSWTSRSVGMINSDVRTIATTSSGSIFAGTYGGGLYRFKEGGWTRVPLNRGYIASLMAQPDGSIYAGTTTQSGGTPGMFRSTDDGITWTPITFSGASTTIMATDNHGTIYYTDGSAVYRQRTADTSWTRIRSSRYIHALAVDSAGYLFIGVEDTGLFRSTDQGGTWMKATGIGGYYTDITAIAAAGGEIFAAGTGIYRSTDSGATWHSVTGIAPRSSGYALMADRDGSLYAGCNREGVFRSSNHGATWDTLISGLASIEIHALARDSSGHILVGTETAGLYRSSATSSVPVRATGAPYAPSAIAAISAMPNPCSSTSTLAFTIAMPGHVSIDLFDIRGLHVRHIAEGNYPAGLHTTEIGVDDLAAGMYVCRLRAGETIASTRFIVSR